jgi:hypothetical protein
MTIDVLEWEIDAMRSWIHGHGVRMRRFDLSNGMEHRAVRDK